MVAAERFTLTKACGACVKAKRKCDMRLPECGRCSKKKALCRYKNEPLSGRDSEESWPASLQQSLAQVASKDKRRPVQCHQIQATSGGSKHSSSPGSDSSEGSNFDRSPSAISLCTLGPTVPDMPLRVDQPTADYLLFQLKRFPQMLVTSGSTPFIHPLLYRNSLPKAIRHAYSACSVDLQQSSMNQSISSQALDSTITDLLDARSSIVTFDDGLAFVQALILIQILTLFSPYVTIEQRMEADAREQVLDQWAYKLWSQAPSELPASLSSFDAYIYAESVRRTIHIWNKLRCTYDFFSKGYFTHTLFAEALPFDRRSSLWNITDEEAWLEQNAATVPEMVSYRELAKLWDAGEILHGGLFETMLLTARKGRSCVEARIEAREFIEV